MTAYRTREYTQALMAIADLFASRHWTYGVDGHVPDVEELAHAVDSLVSSLATNGDEWVQSGRFLVMADGFNGVDIFVHVGTTS